MTYHLKQWLGCLKHYALMCLFISSPDKLPNSVHCILLSLLGYLLLNLSLVDIYSSLANIVTALTMELMLLAIITYAGLWWRKTLPRFNQTISALVGVNLVISLISFPLYHSVAQETARGTELTQAVINASLAILIWNLAVLSLIFKRAFELSTMLSAMISFCYFVFLQFMVAKLR